jgi:hypothetical protein
MFDGCPSVQLQLQVCILFTWPQAAIWDLKPDFSPVVEGFAVRISASPENP